MCKNLRETYLPSLLIGFLWSTMWDFEQSLENPDLVWENRDPRCFPWFLELIFREHLPGLLFYLCAKFEVDPN